VNALDMASAGGARASANTEAASQLVLCEEEADGAGVYIDRRLGKRYLLVYYVVVLI
jgi:hypothetical protein